MKFEIDKLKIEVFGESVEMDYPNISQLNSMNKKMEELGEFEATISLLEELGLKRELSSKFRPIHLQQLTEKLFESEKKN
ncbi:MAG: hypothetical protein OEL89_00335 [Candidatus Peregrinibacteria bacterium]|nr:hypothetical protein [Candidatus Peregrinibacteria bacterium]